MEIKFCKSVIEKGLLPLKFSPLGQAGFPDRIILKPGGKTVFAEIKAPGKKPRLLQIKRINQLAKFGFKTYVIDSLADIEDFIKNECS